MKKLLIGSLIGLTVFGAQAHEGHGYWRPHGNGWGWVAPAVVGGAVVYAVTRPPVVVQQPVIVQDNRVINDSNCSPWTQIRNPDGSVTVTRTCQ